MDEPQFIDAQNYRSSQEQGTTIKDIIMRQVERCAIAGSKEMKEGEWIEHNVVVGGGAGVLTNASFYLEDTRKTFIESVNTLFDLLYPFILKHKEIQKQLEELEKEGEEYKTRLRQKYSKETDESTIESWFFKYLVLNRRKIFRELNILLQVIGYMKVKNLVQDS